MNNVATVEGRTVLFVSHNMAVVQHLCRRAILLKQGNIAYDGVPETAISQHLSDAVGGGRVDLEDWADRNTNGEARISTLEWDDGRDGASIMFGGDLRVRMHIRFNTPVISPIFGVIIHDATGVPISNAQSSHDGLEAGTVCGQLLVEAYFRKLGIYPGRYLLSPWITDSTLRYDIDFPRMCALFDIHPAPGEWGDLKLNQEWGKVHIPSQWGIRRVC